MPVLPTPARCDPLRPSHLPGCTAHSSRLQPLWPQCSRVSSKRKKKGMRLHGGVSDRHPGRCRGTPGLRGADTGAQRFHEQLASLLRPRDRLRGERAPHPRPGSPCLVHVSVLAHFEGPARGSVPHPEFPLVGPCLGSGLPAGAFPQHSRLLWGTWLLHRYQALSVAAAGGQAAHPTGFHPAVRRPTPPHSHWPEHHVVTLPFKGCGGQSPHHPEMQEDHVMVNSGHPHQNPCLKTGGVQPRGVRGPRGKSCLGLHVAPTRATADELNKKFCCKNISEPPWATGARVGHA